MRPQDRDFFLFFGGGGLIDWTSIVWTHLGVFGIVECASLQFEVASTPALERGRLLHQAALLRGHLCHRTANTHNYDHFSTIRSEIGRRRPERRAITRQFSFNQ